MSKLIKTIWLVSLGLMLVASLGVNAGQAETADINNLPSPLPEEYSSDGGQITTIYAPEEEAYALMDYWTLERRRAAKPMPLPTYIANASGGDNEEYLGDPGSTRGKWPNTNANWVAKFEYPQEWLAARGTLEQNSTAESDFVNYGTGEVFTSYLTNYYGVMWKYYPNKAIGRLYLNGGYCTASVISPTVIVTAAHCVYDTDTQSWIGGWTFVPADRNGAAPYGTFSWSSARILTAWKGTADTIYDVAVIKLKPNSAGRDVSYYVGYLGRSWNWGYTQNLFAVGYPGNLNSGRYTYTCAAESFRADTDVLGMGCDMTFGSSGGPWMRKYAPNRGGALNLVFSVVHGGDPSVQTFYGVRFTSNNIVPLCNNFCN